MTDSDICTTQQAAKMLGISVTSVQQLVESGEIEAWKTKGGHRRISLAAVQCYRGTLAAPTPVSAPATKPLNTDLTILIVEDDKMQRLVYDRQIRAWNLPASVHFCDNGYRALVEIATRKPDILLADIMMDGIDGYEVVTTILSYPDLAQMNIAILSGMPPDDIAARGGVPDGVVFFEKPVNYDELRGFLRACCAQKVRAARAG